MSTIWSEPTRSDEEERYSTHHAEGSTPGGQRHDRIPGDGQNGGANADKIPRPSRELQVSAAQRMMSATWGSVLTTLLVTPLDVVRVRLQIQNTQNAQLFQRPSTATAFAKVPPNLGITACCRDVFWVDNQAQFCVVNPNGTLQSTSSASGIAADCAVEETQRRTFNSTFDGIKKIARNDGVLSLWRGLTPTLVMAIPGNVIYFAGYDSLRYSHRSPINTHVSDTYAPLVAGSVARVAAGIAISPIEMFRTRMQAASGSGTGLFRATFDGLHQLTRIHGYSSLWRGLTLTMWRDVPFSGIYWWGYEAVRNSLADARDKSRGRVLDPNRSTTRRRSDSQQRENHTQTFVDSFIAGATSGAVAALITTPFDVGKTRQQTFKDSLDDLSQAKAPKSIGEVKATPIAKLKDIHLRPEQLSMPKFLYHIFKTEGLAGLFTGWVPRVLKVAPACAIMISSYEIGKKMAGQMNEKREESAGS